MRYSVRCGEYLTRTTIPKKETRPTPCGAGLCLLEKICYTHAPRSAFFIARRMNVRVFCVCVACIFKMYCATHALSKAIVCTVQLLFPVTRPDLAATFACVTRSCCPSLCLSSDRSRERAAQLSSLPLRRRLPRDPHFRRSFLLQTLLHFPTVSLYSYYSLR